MIFFQCIERIIQGTGDRSDLICFGGIKFVQVFLQRWSRVYFIGYAVHTGQQNCGKGQVGVAGGIRTAVLNPFFFWRVGMRWNAY
jgi:hypothetical protein